MGWFEDSIGGGDYGFPKSMTASCPATKSGPLLAQIDDLERTWKPTGYYTWREMADLTASIAALSGKASSLAIKTFEGGESDALRKAAAEYSSVSGLVLYYVDAWKKAQVANTLVNAPGFKDWAIKDLRAAHKLMRIAEIQACNRPWWADYAVGYVQASYGVIGVAKSIGSAVVSAGEAVIDASKAVVGFWPVIKWVGLGVGLLFASVYAYNKFNYTMDRVKSAGNRPFDWSGAFSKIARRIGRKPSPPVAGRRLLR